MGEIVFFDVETSVPSTAGRSGRFWLLEFGAIMVCPKKLVEVGSYSTLIRPGDMSVVPSKRLRGITREALASAPSFSDVADHIFSILDGRVWIGHNIQRFDCHRIREAFADIDRPAPHPLGVIDSLSVLTQEFGRRAGDLKMATLASYFSIGQQKHRSIDDARMNLEVLKHCATVLLLESSLPNVLSSNRVRGVGVVTRSRAANNNCCREEAGSRKSPPATVSTNPRPVPYKKNKAAAEKVVERTKEALKRGGQASRPLTMILRPSRALVR